ncbi:eukaryotic translation initiation factor 5B-like [Uloborus diversus]|uniref:eukaryotic translation initiation factor 5B-like n=1 Tax=Uloborus diversus TaxID=327109 RepID=UPI00240A9398|nr:eukaryotic translation initiation factor 5B-like [Uloborus diversus]
MGRTRKLKEVNQNYHVISDDEGNSNEVRTDFLTSDNFCIVQKKKHTRKNSDGENEVKLPRSRCNSGKNFNLAADDSSTSDGGKNNHTSFWKSHVQKLAPEMVEKNSDSLEVEEPPEISSSSGAGDFEFQLPGLKENGESECSASTSGISSSETLDVPSSTTLKEITLDLEASKVSFNFLANDPEEDMVLEKSVLGEESGEQNQLKPENSDSYHSSTCVKNKSARRHKKKAVKQELDEELEKILKELGIDDDNVSKSQQKRGSGRAKSAKKLQYSLKNETSCQYVTNSEKNLEATLVASCDYSFSKNEETETAQICKSETAVADNDLDSQNVSLQSLSKKKAKRVRQKLRKLESINSESSEENSNSCEKNSEASKVVDVSSNVQKKVSGKDEKKDAKRLSKKQLQIIQEALKKHKEDEDRLRKEEEAKRKAAEEAELARLEKQRLELEKKTKKKLKEKERKEKLKSEGRYLSKSQKQSRARMEVTLAHLRQQGINIPDVGEKKPHGPRLGNDKSLNRKRHDSVQSSQNGDTIAFERKKSESLSSQESGKYTVSDLPSSFESKDSWEFSSIEGSSALTAESGHLSCSEESDILDLDEPSGDYTPDREIINPTNSTEKSNLTDHLNSTNILHSESKYVKLRSPVVCVLGHVDTGKTKILDYIRKTHVQDSEAGGITQQIGATMIPREALREKCKMVQNSSSFEMKIPGLLVIDTPGHESFSNLRSRGSSICDIAILVVDIMHGLEPQTIESINLLKRGKIPFIVVLNKIDRLYGWKSSKDGDIRITIESQSPATLMEFKKRCQDVVLQFANQCLNAALFYENTDPRSYVSMVPTSAITGDGMGNMLALVAQYTQSMMHKQLTFSKELEATVLEVKAIPGLGTTIDVILVNGRLREGDTIVLAGHDGPYVTQIRSLLMPQPLKELRVKNPYKEYRCVEGAQGVKITGKDLDKSIAGLPLLVADNLSKVEQLKKELLVLFREYMNSVKTSERGVYVQASTLGSLEALLEFLKQSDIPYFAVKIGPVVKKDVMKASIMLEHDVQYACILAFDVKIERDAQELADSLGVHVFHADIIYHLFDMYVKFRDELLLKRRDEIKRSLVFPCKVKVLPEFIFSPKDPIILGVAVEAGILKEGTPLCVPSKDIVEIGTVTSIELNRKQVNSAKKGQEVCITIEPKQGESPKMYGKHFDDEDILVSRITRQSIDVCKEHYREELQASDWQLIVELKKLLHIV